MKGIVDFHSHILPGVDDGSASVEESIAMLRMEADQGVRHVVVTPHFYAQHDSIADFLERRAESEKRLRGEMAKYHDLPEITVGAEVYFFRGISQSEVLHQLTIGKTPYCLIEMPHAPWTDSMYRELEEIYYNQGIIPIIAHVDRYIGSFRTYGIPGRLAELPVVVQANAGFFLKKSTSAMALRMLKANRIHLLGSDCHNLSSRSPNLCGALALIRRRLGDSSIDAIHGWQQHVLQDEL